MKFEVRLGTVDLWRFSMYHVNKGIQGIFNLLFTAAAILTLVFAWDQLSGGYIAFLVMCALIFSVWQPFLLYLKSRKQAQTAGIREPLTLEFGEENVKVSQVGQEMELPWDQVAKIVKTRHMVIVYTDRIHAYLLPVETVGNDMEKFSALLRARLPKERLRGL